MATGVSPILQSAAMRSGADDPDGASGLYVTAFQVGIVAGSLVGVAGLLYEGSVAVMLTASAGLMGIALVGMAATGQLLDLRRGFPWTPNFTDRLNAAGQRHERECWSTVRRARANWLTGSAALCHTGPN